ncbi:MAG: copper resistance protein NlpE N-terminal domain-containing protein [Bacteroidota bacterium]
MKKTTLMTCVALLMLFRLEAGQWSYAINNDQKSTIQSSDSSLPLKEQVSTNLLDGVWITEQEDEFVEELWTFEANGVMQVLRRNENDLYTKHTNEWKLNEKNGMIEVQMMEASEVITYTVSPSDNGYLFVNAENGISKTMTYESSMTNVNLNAISNELIGEWENILPSVTLQAPGNPEIPSTTLTGVRVNLTFKADGTFTKSITGNSSVKFEEKGTWDLSMNGQYINLHSADASGKQVTQCVKIRHLDIDELVLEQPLALIGFSYSKENKLFYFNKI